MFGKLLRWFVVFVALALIVRSQSRGQLIARLLAVMALIPYSRGNKQLDGLMFAFVRSVYCRGPDVRVWQLRRRCGESMDPGNDGEVVSQSTRLEFSSKVLTYWFESGPLYWLFGIGSSGSYRHGFSVRIVTL